MEHERRKDYMGHDELISTIEEKVFSAVDKKINGKIDKIHRILEKQNETMDVFVKKVDAHIETVTPWIQAQAGFKIIFKWLIGIGAMAGAWLAVKGILPK